MNLESLLIDVQRHVDSRTDELLPTIFKSLIHGNIGTTSCSKHTIILDKYIKLQIQLSRFKRALREHYNCDCVETHAVKDGIVLHHYVIPTDCVYEKKVASAAIERDGYKRMYHEFECKCLLQH